MSLSFLRAHSPYDILSEERQLFTAEVEFPGMFIGSSSAQHNNEGEIKHILGMVDFSVLYEFYIIVELQ